MKKIKQREEDEEDNFAEIRIGDISLKSNCGFSQCRRELKSLLKNKEVKNYLELHQNKKMLGLNSYIG